MASSVGIVSRESYSLKDVQAKVQVRKKSLGEAQYFLIINREVDSKVEPLPNNSTKLTVDHKEEVKIVQNPSDPTDEWIMRLDRSFQETSIHDGKKVIEKLCNHDEILERNIEHPAFQSYFPKTEDSKSISESIKTDYSGDFRVISEKRPDIRQENEYVEFASSQRQFLSKSSSSVATKAPSGKGSRGSKSASSISENASKISERTYESIPSYVEIIDERQVSSNEKYISTEEISKNEESSKRREILRVVEERQKLGQATDVRQRPYLEERMKDTYGERTSQKSGKSSNVFLKNIENEIEIGEYVPMEMSKEELAKRQDIVTLAERRQKICELVRMKEDNESRKFVSKASTEKGSMGSRSSKSSSWVSRNQSKKSHGAPSSVVIIDENQNLMEGVRAEDVTSKEKYISAMEISSAEESLSVIEKTQKFGPEEHEEQRQTLTEKANGRNVEKMSRQSKGSTKSSRRSNNGFLENIEKEIEIGGYVPMEIIDPEELANRQDIVAVTESKQKISDSVRMKNEGAPSNQSRKISLDDIKMVDVEVIDDNDLAKKVHAEDESSKASRKVSFRPMRNNTDEVIEVEVVDETNVSKKGPKMSRYSTEIKRIKETHEKEDVLTSVERKERVQEVFKSENIDEEPIKLADVNVVPQAIGDKLTEEIEKLAEKSHDSSKNSSVEEKADSESDGYVTSVEYFAADEPSSAQRRQRVRELFHMDISELIIEREVSKGE